MEKTYNPQDIEQPLYEHWEKQGYFKPNGDESRRHRDEPAGLTLDRIADVPERSLDLEVLHLEVGDRGLQLRIPVHQPLTEHWAKQGYFKPNGDESQESFCIMIPPPNVTGTLHMGHAFQQPIRDTRIRYQRMQGQNTLWQAGTDHAGIATQMVV